MAYAGSKVPISLGKMGLHSDDTPGALAPGELVWATNVDLSNGIIQKVRGSRRWNNSALSSPPIHLHEWFPDGISRRVVVACEDGQLRSFKSEYKVTTLAAAPEAPTTLQMGKQVHFTPGGRINFTQNRKLFFFSGNNVPQVIDGLSNTRRSITNPAVDWANGNYPQWGIVFRERLFVLFGHTVLASTRSDQEDFVTVGGDDPVLAFSVFPGEGERLVTGWVFRGKLFVAKYPSGIYVLNDDSADPDQWYFKRVHSFLGCASGHSSAEVTEDIFFANQFGTVSSLSAAFQLGDVKFADVVSTLRVDEFASQNLDLANHDVRWVLYDKNRQICYYSYASKDSLVANRLLALDLTNQKAKITLITKDLPRSLGLITRDGVPVAAYPAADGYLYTLDSQDRDKAGSGYEFKFYLPETDLGEDTSKNLDFIELTVEETGGWTLYCDVFLDGEFSETIQFTSANPHWLSATADANCFVLDQDRLIDRKGLDVLKKLHGRGKRIGLQFYTDDSSIENFKITGLTIFARKGNDDNKE